MRKKGVFIRLISQSFKVLAQGLVSFPNIQATFLTCLIPLSLLHQKTTTTTTLTQK